LRLRAVDLQRFLDSVHRLGAGVAVGARAQDGHRVLTFDEVLDAEVTGGDFVNEMGATGGGQNQSAPECQQGPPAHAATHVPPPNFRARNSARRGHTTTGRRGSRSIEVASTKYPVFSSARPTLRANAPFCVTLSADNGVLRDEY